MSFAFSITRISNFLLKKILKSHQKVLLIVHPRNDGLMFHFHDDKRNREDQYLEYNQPILDLQDSICVKFSETPPGSYLRQKNKTKTFLATTMSVPSLYKNTDCSKNT